MRPFAPPICRLYTVLLAIGALVSGCTDTPQRISAPEAEQPQSITPRSTSWQGPLNGPIVPNATPELNLADDPNFARQRIVRRVPVLSPNGRSLRWTTSDRLGGRVPQPKIPIDDGGGGGDPAPLDPPPPAGTDAHRGWFMLAGTSGRTLESSVAIGYGPSQPYSFTNKWVTVPNAWTDALFYAPTTMPPGSCVEVTIIHWHGARYGVSADHAFGVWDWCNRPAGPFAYLENMNSSTWLNRYAFGHANWAGTDERISIVRIQADNPNAAPGTSDCWSVLLWNGSAYEQKYRSCGVSQVGTVHGWTMHESMHMQNHYAPGCPTVPSLYADGLYTFFGSNSNSGATPLRPPGDPSGMTTDLSDGYCWSNGSYSLSSVNAPPNSYAGWQALTPTPTF